MSESIKILVVDDEPDILEFIKYNLEKENYKVWIAANGSDAINIAKEIIPDLILLDVMMPGIDGVETCRRIREFPEFNKTIVSFLTARGEEYTEIAGFDAGADDFILKPIRPRLLVSRIKGLLRRVNLMELPETNFEKIKINREKYLIEHEGKNVFLPKKEFELFALLFSKPGKVFTREEILSRVWGEEVIVGDRTIDVHIRKLREKLGEEIIRTIKGVGYKIEMI